MLMIWMIWDINGIGVTFLLSHLLGHPFQMMMVTMKMIWMMMINDYDDDDDHLLSHSRCKVVSVLCSLTRRFSVTVHLLICCKFAFVPPSMGSFGPPYHPIARSYTKMYEKHHIRVGNHLALLGSWQYACEY